MPTGIFSIPISFNNEPQPQVWIIQDTPRIWELASRSVIWPLEARPTEWVVETSPINWVLPKRAPTCLFEDSITINTALQTEGSLIEITTENSRAIEEEGNAIKNRDTLAGCWTLLERG